MNNNAKQYHWWEVYGHFSPGEENLPCLGEVIAYYMAINGVSVKELAQSLECTERYVNKMKNPTNTKQPELLSRRLFLAKKLSIPLVLLGLSPIAFAQWGDNAQDMLVPGDVTDFVAEPATMQRSEKLLALSWELYYTSTVQKALPFVEQSYAELQIVFGNAAGLRRDQFDAMRCRFLQLYSLIYRDQDAIETALLYEDQAIEIAYRLKNAELIASSLQRRSRIYLSGKRYKEGLADALKALPYGDLSRDPTKGKCYQIAGEVVGFLAAGRRDWQERSIAYYDKAIEIARHGDLSQDGSFYRSDLTSVLIEKAETLSLFGRYDDAHAALETARENLSPTVNRWRLNLLVTEAQIYVAQHAITDAAYVMSDALSLAHDLDLPRKVGHIQALFIQARHIEPGNEQLAQVARQLALII